MNEEQRLRAIESAQKAVAHLLTRMNNSEPLRREIGFGTESYELLTSAAAELFCEPIEKVREFYKG